MLWLRRHASDQSDRLFRRGRPTPPRRRRHPARVAPRRVRGRPHRAPAPRRVPRARDAARLGGPGGIPFDDPELARAIGIVGLVAILFEGGLQTAWRRLRQVAVPAALLRTVGVLVTAIVTGGRGPVLFDDLTWTRPPARRRRRLHRRGRGLRDPALHASAAALARMLEAESGGNDPFAVALTIGLIGWIEGDDRGRTTSACSSSAARLGLVFGVVLGLGASWAWRACRPRSAPSCRSRRSRPRRSPSAPPTSRRERLPRGLRRRPVRGEHALAVPPRDRVVPPGRRVPRPGRPVRRARPARLPERLAPVARPGIALALVLLLVARPRRSGSSTASAGLHRPERRCSAGRACAGRCRSCSPRSRSPRGSAERHDLQRGVLRRPRLGARCRGGRSSGLRGELGLLSARARPRSARRSRSGNGRPRAARVHGSRPTTRSPASVVRELGLPRERARRGHRPARDESIPPRGSTRVEPGDQLFVLTPRSMRRDVEDALALTAARVAESGRSTAEALTPDTS